MPINDYSQDFADAGQQNAVDPRLLKSIGMQESGGNPNAVSPKGAVGIMQLMPSTAKELGVDAIIPQQNIHGGAKYFKQQVDKYKDQDLALMAYNWGPDNVDKWLKNGANPASIPKETQQYLAKIKNNYQGSQGNMPESPLDSIDRAYNNIKDNPGESSASPLDSIDKAYEASNIERPEDQKAAAAAQVQTAQASATPYDQLARQVGLTARYGIEGVSSLPAVLGNGVNTGINYATQGINKLTGANIPQLGMPTQTISNALTSFGLPQPRTKEERLVGDVARGIAGAGASVGAGNALASIAGEAAPILSGVGESMEASPVTQLASGATGAGASGLTREGGGGVIPQMVAGLAGGAIIPAATGIGVGSVRPEVASLAKSAAKDYGINLPAAQITENPFIKWLDAALPTVAFSGHGGELANAKSQFTRAVSNTFGENTPNLTKNTMEGAADNIGKMYDDVLASTPRVKISDNTLNKIADIDQEAKEVLTPDEYNKISKQIGHIQDKAAANGGELPSEIWHNFTKSNSPLSKLTRQHSDAAPYAYDLKSTLHDALGESAPAEMTNKFTKANQYWKNYKTVQTLAEKDPTTGDINPASLLTQTLKTSRKYGQGGMNDLQNLAAIGNKFFKNMPSSGTSERSHQTQVLSDVGIASGLLASGHPIGAAITLGSGAGAAGASRLASMAINSKWYKNKLLQSALSSQRNNAPIISAPLTASILNNRLTNQNLGY